MKQNSSSETSPVEHSVEESRRYFLKTAGKLAIYTPPSMMLLMQPSQATFNKSSIGRDLPIQQEKHQVITIIGKFLRALHS